MEKQLVFRAEYRNQPISAPENNFNSDSDSAGEEIINLEDNDEEGFVEAVVKYDGGDENDEIVRSIVNENIFVMEDIADLLKEQSAIDNIKFLEAYFKSETYLVNNRILLNEIQKLKRRRKTSATWSLQRHPATMYLN